MRKVTAQTMNSVRRSGVGRRLELTAEEQASSIKQQEEQAARLARIAAYREQMAAEAEAGN